MREEDVEEDVGRTLLSTAFEVEFVTGIEWRFA